MSAPGADLCWDEPDSGCVACGRPYVTVADHRCGTCIGESVAHCPHCLSDIEELINREVVRRLRATSHDVNDAWVEGKHYASFVAHQRVEAARARSGAAHE